MKYKLFLSDFDGTLVRDDGIISEKNKQAIAKYTEMGGTFAVCTGRPLNSILPRVRELGLQSGLVVAFQGAVIADIQSGKLLKDGGLTREQALKAIRELEARDLHIHIYTAEQFLCNKDDYLLKGYEHVTGIHAEIEEHLSERVERENLSIIKALVLLRPEEREAQYEALPKALGDEFFITCSADWLIEVMPAAAHKGAGVKFLSEYFNVPFSETAAIGDQLNDLAMLEAVGGKFAVANAKPELKEIAQVVSSNEEDGVAEALEIAMGE